MAFDVTSVRAALQRDLAAVPDHRSEPLWANLSQEGHAQLGRLVDWLAKNRPDIYTIFAGEGDLGASLTDAVERLGNARWSLNELLERTVTDAVGTWVVPVPLVGVAAPPAVRALDDSAVLTPAGTWRNDRVDTRETQSEVALLCGAPVAIGSRYMHDSDDQLLDTRRTATLIWTLRGTREWCKRIAFEQTRFLVAGWTLFSPPETEMHTPMWPQVTEWQPQPQLHVQETVHRIEADGRTTKHRGMTIVHGPDDVALWPWPEEEVVAMVLRAIRASGGSRAATALVTAAWDLYLAARNPSDALGSRGSCTSCTRAKRFANTLTEMTSDSKRAFVPRARTSTSRRSSLRVDGDPVICSPSEGKCAGCATWRPTAVTSRGCGSASHPHAIARSSTHQGSPIPTCAKLRRRRTTRSVNSA